MCSTRLVFTSTPRVYNCNCRRITVGLVQPSFLGIALKMKRFIVLLLLSPPTILIWFYITFILFVCYCNSNINHNNNCNSDNNSYWCQQLSDPMTIWRELDPVYAALEFGYMGCAIGEVINLTNLLPYLHQLFSSNLNIHLMEMSTLSEACTIHH